MESVLSEINKIRGGKPCDFDFKNGNVYRLVSKEPDGSKTAYYFSSPIYNSATRELLKLHFDTNKSCATFKGINAIVSTNEKVALKNKDGAIELTFSEPIIIFSKSHVGNSDIEIKPTLNGIVCKADIRKNGKITFVVDNKEPFMRTIVNGKYFALMKEKFKPLANISCIGTLKDEQICAPAGLCMKKLSDKSYEVTILPCVSPADYVMFEVNMHCDKLYQDTTVEDKNPDTNNVFGTVAFIGQTEQYGEQELYTRLDITKARELLGYNVKTAALYIPTLNEAQADLIMHQASTRFCSFGSTWNSKKPMESNILTSTQHGGYYRFDLPPNIFKTKLSIQSEGLVLRAVPQNGMFSAVATGDSCFAPQILEINFK